METALRTHTVLETKRGWRCHRGNGRCRCPSSHRKHRSRSCCQGHPKRWNQDWHCHSNFNFYQKLDKKVRLSSLILFSVVIQNSSAVTQKMLVFNTQKQMIIYSCTIVLYMLFSKGYTVGCQSKHTLVTDIIQIQLALSYTNIFSPFLKDGSTELEVTLREMLRFACLKFNHNLQSVVALI